MGKDASSVAVAVRSAGDFEVLPEDTELFHSHLRSFVPPEAFDAHAHFYERSHIGPTFESSYLKSAPDPGGWAAYRRQVSKWMGDRTAKGGLFFAMPRRDVDMAGANRFLAAETGREDRLKALMLIRPEDDPDRVEEQIASQRFVGFKVYLVYADREDPYKAEIEEFLPEWAWEIADKRGLAIMLHLVKPRAMADPAKSEHHPPALPALSGRQSHPGPLRPQLQFPDTVWKAWNRCVVWTTSFSTTRPSASPSPWKRS